MVVPDVLWLSASPSLKRFDQPLLKLLSRQVTIAQWEYYQTPDEACSLEIALVLLHDYLKACAHPVHLCGHGISGLVALLYAQRHPERVKSLVLLSVGVHPAVDWQAHYYMHRQLLSCSQSMILAQMVTNLFGPQSHATTRELVKILEQDLESSLSPHTLFRRISIPPISVKMPLMVCGGGADMVVDRNQLQGWREWQKVGDRLWSCPDAGYFFHFVQPDKVAQALSDFWLSLPALAQQTESNPQLT
ncbi:MAG: alpha/beta hydrolase [Synechococcales cyanobacterium C42_A2020_086]|jgi:pimeloyl-ACP methyl ester carboxylesterase|nr:alpha/beta hydrolase [Synechococcales cyanobacterium C42_A2020_086]